MVFFLWPSAECTHIHSARTGTLTVTENGNFMNAGAPPAMYGGGAYQPATLQTEQEEEEEEEMFQGQQAQQQAPHAHNLHGSGPGHGFGAPAAVLGVETVESWHAPSPVGVCLCLSACLSLSLSLW